MKVQRWRLCGWEGATLGCEEQRLRWLLVVAALLPAHLLSALSNAAVAAVLLERMQWNDLQLHQHLSVTVLSQGKARKCPVKHFADNGRKGTILSGFTGLLWLISSNTSRLWAVILSLPAAPKPSIRMSITRDQTPHNKHPHATRRRHSAQQQPWDNPYKSARRCVRAPKAFPPALQGQLRMWEI